MWRPGWDGCCEGYPNQNIQYDLDTPTVVSGYDFITAEGECPVAWSTEVSDDGVDWVTVDHHEGEGCHEGDAVTYQLDQPVTSRHFRWQFTGGEGGNANGIRLAEIRLLFCAC